jgi:hypothetical protein
MPFALTKDWVLGGHAIFTVANPKGTRYTYKIVGVEDRNTLGQLIYFMSLLSGPDNTDNYVYMGIVSVTAGRLIRTRATKLNGTLESWRVAEWVLALLWNGKSVPEGYYLSHAGRCGRCGRLLTVPESIEAGLGPDCAARGGE